MASKNAYKPFDIIKDIYFRFQDDDVPALAAQLTYYFLLSFFPFLIFLITLVSYTPITSERALENLSNVLPESAYGIVSDAINQIANSNRTTFISFGMIATILAASNGMNALIRVINKAYDQHEERSFWKIRTISITSTLALAFTILFSFVLLVLGEIIGENLFDFLGHPNFFKPVWTILRFIIPLLIMLLVFTFVYHFTPSRRFRYREVIPGSIFSTLGWILTSLIFSFYINNFGNFSRTYGSLGGIIALLVWLYWISIIVMLGGELNASLAFMRAGIKKHAVQN